MPSLLNGPQADPFYFIFLFASRMTRGHEKASTSQAGRKRGTPLETPIISILVTVMFVDELRSFSQVPGNIRLEVADGLATPTIRRVDNAV